VPHRSENKLKECKETYVLNKLVMDVISNYCYRTVLKANFCDSLYDLCSALGALWLNIARTRSSCQLEHMFFVYQARPPFCRNNK
jgi:hypothetical protein